MLSFPSPLVTADWLVAHRSQVVVVDVRWYLDRRTGRAAYDAGHIAGAVFADLDRDLAGPPSTAAGRHPLPEPEDFAVALSRLGIGDENPVVAYDDAGGMVAARLVWMLRALGHPAALLDGGLGAWPAALSTLRVGPRDEVSDTKLPAAHFTPRPWPAARLATIDEVATAADSGGFVLLDARAEERYTGAVEPLDPRAGHIPGAVNVPTAGNVDPDSGRFLDAGDLRSRFAAAGVTEGADVVAYCGSGVTACHELLALEESGLGPGRLYAGSWSQWSGDPERPGVAPSAPSEGPS